MIGKFVKRNSQKNGNKIKKISRVFYGTGKVSYDTNCVWNFKNLGKLAPSQRVVTRLREKKKKIRSLCLGLRKLEDYFCQGIRPVQV